MHAVQSAIFVVGALLFLGAGISAMLFWGAWGVVFGVVLLGLAGAVGLLAFAALAPDRPVRLKPKREA